MVFFFFRSCHILHADLTPLQTRRFWTVFVKTFDHFVWNYGVMKDFPLKVSYVSSHSFVSSCFTSPRLVLTVFLKKYVCMRCLSRLIQNVLPVFYVSYGKGPKTRGQYLLIYSSFVKVDSLNIFLCPSFTQLESVLPSCVLTSPVLSYFDMEVAVSFLIIVSECC